MGQDCEQEQQEFLGKSAETYLRPREGMAIPPYTNEHHVSSVEIPTLERAK